MTTQQMRDYLLHGHDNDPYAEASRVLGGFMLLALEECKNEQQFTTDQMYGLAKVHANKLNQPFDDGYTGFMVGWAANAVRYVMSKKIQENPAIVTIGED